MNTFIYFKWATFFTPFDFRFIPFARLLDRLHALRLRQLPDCHVIFNDTTQTTMKEKLTASYLMLLAFIWFISSNRPFFSRSLNKLFFVQSASWIRIARRYSMEIWQYFLYYVCKIVSTNFIFFDLTEFFLNQYHKTYFVHSFFWNSWKYQKDCAFVTHDETRHKYAQHFFVYRFFFLA